MSVRVVSRGAASNESRKFSNKSTVTVSVIEEVFEWHDRVRVCGWLVLDRSVKGLVVIRCGFSSSGCTVVAAPCRAGRRQRKSNLL